MSYCKRLALMALIVFAAGCGGKRTDVRGTITRDGKPLVWDKEGGHLMVLFVPDPWTSSSQVVQAQVDRDTGAFTVPEIKSGRYLMAIQQFDDRHNDALNSKYDPSKSPLRVDVTDDGQVIDIDLPKDLPN